MKDWTAVDNVSNSSPEYVKMVRAVEEIILSEGHSLIRGNTNTVARLIVSQLAHEHGLSPRETEAKEQRHNECPKCHGTNLEVRNHDLMWHDGDVWCIDCDIFIRNFDAG